MWANAWDVFRRGLSRVGRGRWANVGFVVCFRWGGIFSCFSGDHIFKFVHPEHSQRRLGGGAPTASQSAHR